MFWVQGVAILFRTTMWILYLIKPILLNNTAQSLSAHSQVLLRYILNLKCYNSWEKLQESLGLLAALIGKQTMYSLGARKFGVTSLPPLGCLPAARTLFGFHEKGCVSRINTDSQQFNKKLNSSAASLQKQLPGLRLVIFDIFQPLYDLVKNPSAQGNV